MEIFEEEKKYLDVTLDVIDKEIKKAKEALEKAILSGRKLSFEDRLRGEHFHINSKAGNATQHIESMQRSKSSPYFGRIDIYVDGKTLEKIYIGRTGVISGDVKYVTDWRAPICSLYYDSELGKTTYKTNVGTDREVELVLKRQINIKNGELIDAVDTELVSNDDLLKPYLSANADNKMKVIISSIQKEQNDIIRKSPKQNLMVQGVAGSGKTSVALHRIAYLIYELGERITSDQFLVIGPNNYFLNYVSSILPELDTSPVIQKTFIDYANEYLKEKISLKEEKDKLKNDEELLSKEVKSFKTTLEYKDILDDYLNKYIEEKIVSDDFTVCDEVVFTKKEVRHALFTLKDSLIDYDRAYFILSTRLKKDLDDIFYRMNKKYRDIYTTYPEGSKEKEEAIRKSSELRKTLKEDGIKLLKKYMKTIKSSTLQIYANFIMELENYNIPLLEKEKLYLQKQTLVDIKKKKLNFEDIPALLHIHYRLTNQKMKFSYIVIDEAQDYGLFHFFVLKELNNANCNFAIYGDLAQSVYPHSSISSWEELNEKVFDNKFEVLGLNKSYRTTIEITENANGALKHLGLKEASPVIRHGLPVEFVDSSDITEKVAEIKRLQSKDYSTIAIICKSEAEAEKLNNELNKLGIESKYICDKDNEYSGGLFVLSSISSKGLEFDAVIINDASEDKYSSKSSEDMHLLYVASTRALHELKIFFDKNLTDVYQENYAKVKKLGTNS